MRGPHLLLAVVLLAPAIAAALAPAAGSAPPAPRPLQLPPADVPTWLVGDAWRYAVDAYMRNATADLELHGNVTFQVASRLDTLFGGSYLRVYNSTVTGDVHGRGNNTVPGIGRVPFVIRSGTLQGYVWNERGDLSIVRSNLTLNATGTATIGPIVMPLLLQGSLRTTSTPPEEDHDFPIALGDTWQMAASTATVGFLRMTVRTPLGDQVFTQPLDGAAPVETRSWVNRTEPITVGAVAYDTFRIESASPGGSPAVRWYAPNASNVARIETSLSASPAMSVRLWANLTDHVATNKVIDVTVGLNPDRVVPGEPFEVWARTSAPDADVSVVIPVTNRSVTGRTDSTGFYRGTINAPLGNDNTPANTDIGSHGVLVTVTNATGKQGFGAATISLLSPDLTIGGLAASPTPAGDGIPGRLRATVSVTTAVPVNGSVNVTFVSADVDVNRDGVLDNSLSVYCGRGECVGTVAVGPVVPGSPVTAQVPWTPNPPSIPATVTVSAIVDSDNRYAETNETNNIAVAAVRVEGPDLTLRNATVEILGSPSTFDPARSGFVSPPITLRAGVTANLTVQVWNVGGANATRPTTLAFYNTTGLNGTGDPPFAQATVPALPAGGGTAPIPTSWTAPPAAGMYYVNVTADRGGVLREVSEANNTFVLRFRVWNATAAADLVPVSVDIPAQASVNRTVFLRTRVENRGIADAGGFHVAFYDGATMIGTALPVGPLPAGVTISFLSVAWSSSVLGPHAIRIVVDVNNEVPESNETNNVATGTTTVVAVPTTTLTIGTPNVVATNTTYILPTTSLTLHAQERTGLGPATIWYRIDSGNWTTIAEGAPFTLPAGAHTVSYNSTDRLGGSDPTRSTSVFVDDEPPTTIAAISDAAGGKAVTLAASDNASGVAWTEYRLDNGTWTRYNNTPILIAGVGTHVVEYRSADRLGNREVAKSSVVRIESGTGATPATAFNVKPFLALAFVVVLLVVGWFAAPHDDRRRRQRWFLTVAVPPAIVEGVTGIASLSVPEMAVPSGSLGLPVDVALLAIGLLVIFFSRRRALRNL